MTAVISELRQCLALFVNSDIRIWKRVNGDVDSLARILRNYADQVLQYEHGDQFVRAIRERLQTGIPADFSPQQLEAVFRFLPSKNTTAWEEDQKWIIEEMRDISLPNLGRHMPLFNCRDLLEQIDDDQLGLDTLDNPNAEWRLEIIL